MYTLRITTRDSKLMIRKKTAKIKVGASVKRGLKGETGEQGPQGPQGIQGDPGTTDYNELQNKPDLTLKADKTYVDTQDTALQAAINTKQPVGDYATDTALASGLATKANTSSLAPVATSGSYTDLTNKPTIPTVPVQSVNTRTGAVTGLAEASDLTAHTGNTSNPHSVTKAQVGLSNADNTSDVNKPISTATQTALDGKFTQRTITGTTNQVTVTNGDGVSGNPTLSLPSAITTPGSLTITGHNSPQADSTYTLGTSSLYWSNTYTDRLYLNSTAYLDGGTAGAVGITGNVSTTGTVSTTVGGAAGAGTQTLASNLYIQARGQNLVTNGSGLLLNNYNFSGFTFDSTETHGGGGSFKKNVAQQVAFNDELIPVNPEKYYRLIGWGKSGDTGGANYNATNRQFLGLAAYDIDGLSIQPYHYAKYPGSTDTTLAAPLNNGDTTITLTNATGWHNGASGHARSIIWYGYTNSKGYTYPDYTYSRTTKTDTWEAGGISGNTITLRAPWPGPNLPAGAAVRNTQSGGTYKYNAAVDVIVPNSWTRYEGHIGGLDTGGTQNTNLFPYGTSYIKLLFLINYHGVADNNIRWSDLEFTEISSRNLETATQSQPGVVSTSSQSFGGLKTFTDGIVSQSTGNSSFAGNVGIGETAPDYKLDVNGSFGFTPGSSVTPVDNGDVTISATNNTTLTFRLKGSDGTVRSGTLTLS